MTLSPFACARGDGLPAALPVQASAGLCSQAEVARLVADFYALVRVDALLGPVFDRHVRDWPAHLAHLTAFWDGLLRGQSGFNGAPLARHLAIDGLQWAWFERWLALFAQAAQAQGNAPMAALACQRAQRIAGHFWQHYQRARGLADPGRAQAGRD